MAGNERLLQQFGPFDASNWAKVKRKGEGEQRSLAAEVGLDGGKFSVALALGSITGDDETKFITIAMRTMNNIRHGIKQFDAQYARREQASVLERLDWEANIEEMPDTIRSLVVSTRDTLCVLDFGERTDYNKAYQLWKQMRDTIYAQIPSEEYLIDVITYTDKNLNKLPGHEEWSFSSTRRYLLHEE